MKPTSLKHCPAPAKINLFLHVVGQRPDGYHLLQSVFQLVDRCDYLDFTVRNDGQIHRTNDIPNVPEDKDLIVRAARLLQHTTGTSFGADITIEKNLPMGGGLGGGSSNAATTLMALNFLWDCHLSSEQLQKIGLQLGADIPFFLFGRNAFVEGIGEVLHPVKTADCWYVIVEPHVSVPTNEIFSNKLLTKNTNTIRITDFPEANNFVKQSFGKNDLESVAVACFPEVNKALSWLKNFGNARMSGSGACVFCPVETEKEADKIVEQVPEYWTAWKAKALQEHPLAYLQKNAG